MFKYLNTTLLQRINLRKNNGGGEVIAAVLLGAVGVALCVIFKTQITTFISNAATTLGTKINEIFG